MLIYNLSYYIYIHTTYYTQGTGANADMKLADFGLSALVRLDEDGYDATESGKRKNFRNLKDVSSIVYVCSIVYII